MFHHVKCVSNLSSRQSLSTSKIDLLHWSASNQLTGNQFETLSLRNECQSIFGNEEKKHTHTHISNKHSEWHPGEFIGISQTIAIFVVEAVEDTLFHTCYRKGELKLSCIRKRSAITIRKLTLAQKRILGSVANSFHRIHVWYICQDLP